MERLRVLKPAGIRATKVTPGDLLTQVQRKTPVVQIILNNESLHFVNIEMQEAGVVPFPPAPSASAGSCRKPRPPRL